MSLLAGKRILFWSPAFFGYEKEIKLELEAMGASVFWIEDRPFSTPLMKALTRHAPRLVQPFCDRHYAKIDPPISRGFFDILLVINGQTLSRQLLLQLRAQNPAAEFVLYMWDSMENRATVAESLSLYNRRFTFDPQSAQQHGMTLRPLFFTRGFEAASPSTDQYTVSFIGTAHTDRYAIVKQIEKSLSPGMRHFWYFYLQAPWVYHLYRLTNPDIRKSKIEEFRFAPLKKSETQNVFQQSRCIVDIEHPQQRGLTMRTFEALGAQKKLITTNANIRDYDFYDPQNIQIVDRNNPIIARAFFEEPYRPLPQATRDRYSCSGWLEDILLS